MKIDWRTVAVGDVLKAPSGNLRVVRAVHRWDSNRPNSKPERRTHLFFVINHCSWTGRCYTTYNVGELIGLGYINTGVRVKFKGRLDQELTAFIQEGGGDSPAPYEFDCCDVRGIR